MMPPPLRIGVLLILPVFCATGHYLIANRSSTRATHFVAPVAQSAQSNQQVADRADISMEEFQRVVVGKQAIVIDAREPNEYAEGHVPGARNFYVNAVENDVSIIATQIDPMADIVIYCEGNTCEDSSRLFDILTQLLGFKNVRLFRGGMTAWEAAKLPIEQSRVQAQ